MIWNRNFFWNILYIKDLNADPFKGAFHYKNYKYLPYTTKSKLNDVKEIAFICNKNKQDVNNRKGLKRLCYGSLVYVKAEKKWYEKTSHSECCKSLHNNQIKEIANKNDLDEYQKLEERLNEYHLKITLLKYECFKDKYELLYN